MFVEQIYVSKELAFTRRKIIILKKSATTSRTNQYKVETTLVNENVDKALGDRIVDIFMIPFMREVLFIFMQAKETKNKGKRIL